MKEEPNFSRLSINKDSKRLFENLLSNRLFLSKCFTSYRGPSGLYEFGPNGSKLKNNLINLWRQTLTRSTSAESINNSIEFFEIESSIILPHTVLKNSGHVDKFDDTLIYDLITGDAYRADHYLLDQNIPENMKEKLEFSSLNEINGILTDFNILSPEGNKMGNACKFNLMFQSKIGAKNTPNNADSTDFQVFLRPETAQNQFLYLPKLLPHSSLPFATFSIGKAFRNEISPKNQLLRLREFEQAEIEYFCKNENDIPVDISKFNETILTFVYYEKEGSEYKQLTCNDTLYNVFQKKLIISKSILYFLGKSVIFLYSLGIKNFRLRQHRPDEMAHYANDCWDIEIWSTLLKSYIECIGIADRSSFDLKCHSKVNNYTIRENLKSEEFKKRYEIKTKYNKKEVFDFCKQFDAEEALNLINEEINKETEEIRKECHISFTGKKKIISKILEMNFKEKTLNFKINFEIEEKLITSVEYLPHVIEPSFGISRILQMTLESAFCRRFIDKPKCLHEIKEEKEDEEKYYLSLPVNLTPTKINISFLKHSFYKNEGYLNILKEIYENLKEFEPQIINRNVNIGRKYISADEQGTCLFITIDDDTIINHKVTIRCRECTNQVYSNISNLKEDVLKSLKEILN